MSCSQLALLVGFVIFFDTRGKEMAFSGGKPTEGFEGLKVATRWRYRYIHGRFVRQS